MADPIDLDSLTDEEVLALGPEEMETLQTQENEQEVEDPNAEEPVIEQVDPVLDEAGKPVDDDPPAGTPPVDAEKGELPAGEEPKAAEVAPVAGEGIDPNAKPTGSEGEEPKPGTEVPPVVDPALEAAAKPPAKEEKPKAPKPEGVLAAAAEANANFFKEVTAPFKADGKEIQVRSSADAIRLMQQGANYSRRMQEMKPLRAQDAMLKDHGIDTPDKLNALIDLSKGTPEAIQKFLKDKNIDPLDLNMENAETYQTPNHKGDPKDVAFRDAINDTLAQDGGTELLQDVNSMWDDQSKEALREQPEIFQNLLAQKSSGVYSQIKKELEYQRTMGYLTSVPFLQAYHQVGDAMQKAGVFGSTKEVQSGEIAPLAAVPLDTGIRKAAPKPETEQPNPNLSATTQPPSSAPSGNVGNTEPDYSSMSDDDFLKLGAPG